MSLLLKCCGCCKCSASYPTGGFPASNPRIDWDSKVASAPDGSVIISPYAKVVDGQVRWCVPWDTLLWACPQQDWAVYLRQPGHAFNFGAVILETSQLNQEYGFATAPLCHSRPDSVITSPGTYECCTQYVGGSIGVWESTDSADASCPQGPVLGFIRTGVPYSSYVGIDCEDYVPTGGDQGYAIYTLAAPNIDGATIQATVGNHNSFPAWIFMNQGIGADDTLVAYSDANFSMPVCALFKPFCYELKNCPDSEPIYRGFSYVENIYASHTKAGAFDDGVRVFIDGDFSQSFSVKNIDFMQGITLAQSMQICDPSTQDCTCNNAGYYFYLLTPCDDGPNAHVKSTGVIPNGAVIVATVLDESDTSITGCWTVSFDISVNTQDMDTYTIVGDCEATECTAAAQNWYYAQSCLPQYQDNIINTPVVFDTGDVIKTNLTGVATCYTLYEWTEESPFVTLGAYTLAPTGCEDEVCAPELFCVKLSYSGGDIYFTGEGDSSFRPQVGSYWYGSGYGCMQVVSVTDGACDSPDDTPTWPAGLDGPYGDSSCV